MVAVAVIGGGEQHAGVDHDHGDASDVSGGLVGEMLADDLAVTAGDVTAALTRCHRRPHPKSRCR